MIVWLLAVAAVLAVASTMVSLFAVWRAQALANWTEQRAQAGRETSEARIAALSGAVGALTADLQALRQEAAAARPAVPRVGLNLSKRSQVLRMHRQGDPPERIAAVLEVPRQEVDLLLKVHRIVIASL